MAEENTLPTQEEIENTFQHGNANQIARMLWTLTLSDPDWEKVQNYCLEFLEYPDAEVRAAAALCLSNIARLHHHMNLNLVLPALYRHRSDTGKHVAENVDMALSDIAIFMHVSVQRDPTRVAKEEEKAFVEAEDDEDDEDEQPPSDEEVQRAFESGDSLRIEQALTGLSLWDSDWRKTEQYCLRFLQHPDPGVRGIAVECLNRILYEHHQLDLDLVLPEVNRLRFDKSEYVVKKVNSLLKNITTILHVPVEPIASTDYVPVGPPPTDGQQALNNSVSIEADKQNRIGVDEKNEEIVVFGRSDNGSYVGDVRTWNQLTDAMRTTLIDKGLVTEQGNIILRDKRGNITGYGKNVMQEA